jgi:hypothetical protein
VLAVLVEDRLGAREILAQPIGIAERLLVVVGDRLKERGYLIRLKPRNEF